MDTNCTEIRLDEYNEFDSITDLEQEWDRFVEANGRDIIMTYGWCRIWWKHYGTKRKLMLFIFKQGENIVGIMPLFTETLWVGGVPINVVKPVGSDYRLSQISPPLRQDVIGSIFQLMFDRLQEKPWDILQLGPLAARYEHIAALQKSLGRCSKIHVVEKKGFVQTYFDVEEDDAYLKKLNKNERTDIRRNYRNLEKISDGENARLIVTMSDQSNYRDLFRRFYNAHQQYWNQQNKLGHFGDWPHAEQFHLDLIEWGIEHGYLRLYEISYGDLNIGYEYNYKMGDRYYEMLNSRNMDKKLNKISTGKINYYELIKAAYKEGVKQIDSMRGHYPHKIKMGGVTANIISLFAVKKGAGQFKFTLLTQWSRIINLFYYKIWFCRLATKIPLCRRRPLSKCWIRTNMFS